MTFDPKNRPNAVPWPPLLYGGAILIALVLGRILPLPLSAAPAIVIAGWLLVGLGLGLDVWAMRTMARAQTTILPHRAADRLVTSGPFGVSRNPIYLGNTIWSTALGLALSNGWFLILGPAAALAVERLAIRREEAHLAAKFGAEWQAYAARVPRWLGQLGRS